MNRLVFFVSLFCVFSGAMSEASPSQPGDFVIQLYHGNEKLPNLWAVEAMPPKAHHFNLEAPRSVQSNALKFETVRESEANLLFQIQDSHLVPGSMVEVSAFLCDNAKTYCMKKKMQVRLDTASAKSISGPFQQKVFQKKSEHAEPVRSSSENIIENDLEKAIRVASQSGKPMLIDFYGIWCPPCNLYNETIFNTKPFGAYAQKFVFLKMDADDERSFELKSKLKIGGYPTLVIAKLKSGSSSITGIEELERVVGYYPPQEFYQRLDQAYAHRNDSPDLRWNQRVLEKWEFLLEQKQYDELLTAVSQLKKTDPYLMEGGIYRWVAESKKNPDLFKSSKNLKQISDFFLSLSAQIKPFSCGAIMHAVDLLSEEPLISKEEFRKLAFSLVDELESRIDPKTFYVKGSELTLADLYSMKMGIAETLKDEPSVIKFRKLSLKAYEKLIHYFETQGNRELRSLNLEYAYLLWKDGRVQEAKKLYQRFIGRYPNEFTFYFAASKMYLELKELVIARELAEKALKYSYGDNRIRSMDRVLNVMKSQGQNKEALARGNDFLKQLKQPEGLQVRTGRYVDALKKTIQQLNGDQT